MCRNTIVSSSGRCLGLDMGGTRSFYLGGAGVFVVQGRCEFFYIRPGVCYNRN